MAVEGNSFPSQASHAPSTIDNKLAAAETTTTKSAQWILKMLPTLQQLLHTHSAIEFSFLSHCVSYIMILKSAPAEQHHEYIKLDSFVVIASASTEVLKMSLKNC